MTTAENPNLTFTRGRHLHRPWIPGTDAWVDTVLEHARSAHGPAEDYDTEVFQFVAGANATGIVVKVADSLRIANWQRNIRTKEQVQEQYINLVKQFPEVIEIRLVEEDEGQSLLTVISAAPFESEPREKVFEAQIEVLQQMEEPIWGFHLVNIEEIPGRSLDDQGDAAGVVVFGDVKQMPTKAKSHFSS